jgi:cyclic pyranopterin phosphate synthase
MVDERLTHLDETGAASMVDVSGKKVTTRMAKAGGSITMKPETFAMITQGTAKKGDVIATARIAGIMAAKKCHELIPLCHPLLISKVSVDFMPVESENRIYVESMVKIGGQTGVEMEALTAVSVACLTLYDMCKAVDRGMVISQIRVFEKSGGKSGHYIAEN